MSASERDNRPECKHDGEAWYKDQEDNIQCADCEDIVKADPKNKMMYKGRAVTLGGRPHNYGSGRNPLCCSKARTGHFYFCVCAARSYCPDHGVKCNGSHS